MNGSVELGRFELGTIVELEGGERATITGHRLTRMGEEWQFDGKRWVVGTWPILDIVAEPTDANVMCGDCGKESAEYELPDGSLVCQNCLT